MREEAEAIMKELKSLHEKINSITVADEKDAAAQKFPEEICRKMIKKTEVGKFIDNLTGSPVVILSEKNDELAKEIFIKQYEEIIKLKRKALKDFEKALDAINEYFLESENENRGKQRKGYLLIDFPAHDCRECQAFGPYNTCGINQKFVNPIPGKLPDWCPIQELPECDDIPVFLEEIKTTFDMKKVIEKLDAERNRVYSEDGSLINARTNISIDKAIEIVKKGGIE